jgi:lysophospholipase L1-like esterase
VKRRALLANALLAAASLVVFGGAAELLARRFDLRPAGGAALVNPPWMGDRVFLRPDYRDEMAKHGVLARYYDLYEWDRFLFYRLRPKANVELLDPFAPPDAIERSRWSVQTNASGFRGPDFELAKRPGTIRVLALGDSSTFGWGVEHFETYPQRLAAALAERLGRPRDEIEVLNLGVPGYSSFQGRVLLERVALALEPDVIVWSYLSNDGAVTGASDAATYAERLGARGALLEVLHTSRAFETLEAWILVARRTLRPPPEPDPREASHRNIASYAVAAANVRAAVAAARGAGVPIVLLAQCVGGEPAQVLAAVARETGAPHLDAPALLRASLPALATEERYDEHRAGLRRRYGAAEVDEHILWLAFLPDRCHPNALGHRLVAESLADLVTDALRAARP